MPKQRIHLLDNLRGLTLISMILYHGAWDLVYMFGVKWPWYRSEGAYIWQQSICWTFILLSGFCWSMGRHKLRRALEVLGLSGIITLATAVFMPDNLILFGVLSAIGTGMLLMIPLDKIYSKWNPYAGCILCVLLFVLTRNINSGTWGFEGFGFGSVPGGWYANLFTAYIGFPPGNFYSSDYFSVFPWIFLYQTGYFIYKICIKRDWLKHLQMPKVPVLAWLGRHSLIVYALHQPVIYGILWVCCQ